PGSVARAQGAHTLALPGPIPVVERAARDAHLARQCRLADSPGSDLRETGSGRSAPLLHLWARQVRRSPALAHRLSIPSALDRPELARIVSRKFSEDH